MTLPIKPIVAVVLLAACVSAHAHGDEDHGKDTALPAASSATQSAAEGDIAASPQRLPDGSVFVPKSTQRLLALRTLLAEAKDQPQSVELRGRVIADPASAGRVQAIQAGIVEAGPRGLPNLGQKVSKGQVLAYLAPQASGLEKAASQAQLAEVDGQLIVAEQKRKRFDQLEGSIPQKDIDAARADVMSLTRRRAALGAGLSGRVPLTTPVSGVLSATHVVAGQVVDARDALFDIVQPERLLVEALAYDASLVGNIDAASALTADKQPLKLTFLGAGRQLREQAIPLQFRIIAPPPLVVGQPVIVQVETKMRIKGIALPQSALTQNGANETIVWVHDAAERFVPRRVWIQPLDAMRSVVTDGLKPGERVVTQGATLLSQIR